MLNFLRQEIAKKEQEKKKTFHAQEAKPIQEMDEEILKFAHLFQEMEELTIVGTNAQRERPVIDIPIEDDIELDLVEMDINTGRIVDIPMDVQTNEAFAQEKTFEDFYQEAHRTLPRFNRESDLSYQNRLHEKAKKAYQEYHNFIIQEGLFGNDMMEISDERVPSNVIIDLGPLHEGATKHYVTKLPVFFETTRDHMISLNQIHALSVASNLEAFEHMGEALRGLLVRDGFREQLYRNEIWDIATPIRVVVPIVMEKFVVGVEFEVDGLRHPYPVMWSIEKKLVHQSKGGKVENKEELMKKLEGTDGDSFPNIKVADKDFDSLKLVCKKDFKESEAIKEAYEMIPNRWKKGSSIVYQEAINFGGMDNAANGAPADSTAPPPLDDGASNAPITPPTDPVADVSTPPPATDAGGVGDAPDQDVVTNPDASTAITNDVSQQIADNVANATAANTAAQGQSDIMSTNPTFDNNVDDTFANLDTAMTGTDSPDMGDMDTPPTDLSTDAEMGDTGGMDDLGGGLDTSTPTDPTDPASSLDDIQTDITDTPTDNVPSSNDEMGGVDIDNMSMDDMVQAGIEKLKTMPMNQLKEFLNDGSGAIGTTLDKEADALSFEASLYTKDDEEEYTMESDALTSELNASIRSVLGGLNANDKSLKEIFHDAKHDAKKLNKIISRAMKAKDFKHAAKELEKLGHAANELVLSLNETPAKEDVARIKESIKHFTGAVRDTSEVIDLNVSSKNNDIVKNVTQLTRKEGDE